MHQSLFAWRVRYRPASWRAGPSPNLFAWFTSPFTGLEHLSSSHQRQQTAVMKALRRRPLSASHTRGTSQPPTSYGRISLGNSAQMRRLVAPKRMSRRFWFYISIAMLCLASLVLMELSVPNDLSFELQYHRRESELWLPSSTMIMNGSINFTDAVHVVETRFMQHQPHLLSLGRARLKLFEAICLQTMKFQDTSDFLWLILIDPNLHHELLEDMKQLLAPHPNFFLIRELKTNVALHKVNVASVESGDIDLLMQAARAVVSRILVHTRLDADDGLARMALKRLRMMGVKQLTPVLSNQTSNGWGVAYCLGRHFEWHPSTQDSFVNETELVMVEKHHCVTPGATFCFLPGAQSFSNLPTKEHQKLQEMVPACFKWSQTSCLHRMSEVKMPLALRARTATSAGMSNVGTIPTGSKVMPRYSNYLESKFNITQEKLFELQHYLRANMKAIAKDNLEGQCARGHSCKGTSKIMLQHLLSEAS